MLGYIGSFELPLLSQLLKNPSSASGRGVITNIKNIADIAIRFVIPIVHARVVRQHGRIAKLDAKERPRNNFGI